MGLQYQVDDITSVDEPFRTLYTEQNGKHVLTAIEGIKPLSEFTTVHTALGKERNEHKATKDKLTAWSQVGTLEEVQAKLDRIAELEAAANGKLDDAAIQKLVDGRLNSVKAPLERQLQQLTAQIGERDQLIQGYKAKETTRSIHDSLRDALKKHEGFQPSAFDDAAMLAERMFEVTEDDRVVTKDGVGVTPGVDAAVWLTEMQQKRPHWWGPTQGGGARGSQQGGGAGGVNPFSKAGWNMTEQARIVRENPQRAEQLARSAGTTVGGMKPAN